MTRMAVNLTFFILLFIFLQNWWPDDDRHGWNKLPFLNAPLELVKANKVVRTITVTVTVTTMLLSVHIGLHNMEVRTRRRCWGIQLRPKDKLL